MYSATEKYLSKLGGNSFISSVTNNYFMTFTDFVNIKSKDRQDSCTSHLISVNYNTVEIIMVFLHV